jgi:hypothetical protein
MSKLLFVAALSAVALLCISMIQLPEGRLVSDSESSRVFGAFTPQIGSHSGYVLRGQLNEVCTNDHYPQSCGGSECGVTTVPTYQADQYAGVAVEENGTHCSEKYCGAEVKTCGQVNLISCSVLGQ